MKIGIIGIAVGRNTHTLILPNQKGWKKELIPNSKQGLEIVVKYDPEKVIFSGNKKWALPLAHSLGKVLKNGQIYYLALKSSSQKGAMGNLPKLLESALKKGISGRPFFQGRPSRPQRQREEREEEPKAKTFQLVEEYDKAGNEVRRAKHNILNCLTLLFPEVVKVERPKGPVPQPEPPWGIWTQKMRPILQKPMVEEIAKDFSLPGWARDLARDSLANQVPRKLREDELIILRDNLRHLAQWEEAKERALESLKGLLRGNSLVKDFNEGDLAYLIAGLLSWRKWPKWRELRQFCGLAVSRIDSQGNPRISRKRPLLRKNLYLLATLTSKGKEISRRVEEAGIDRKTLQRKLRRVKRLERLLKYLWKHHLQ
jgi:hypothetical protein